MRPSPSIPSDLVSAGTFRIRRLVSLAVMAAALGSVLIVWRWPSAAEREATRWIRDYHRLAALGGSQWPDWGLSYPGQLALVGRLTRPESRVAEAWDSLRQAIPASIRPAIPRWPGARNRLLRVAPILIQVPKMPAIRRALLESALDPRASNRRFAVQFACMDVPVPKDLLPLLEQLAGDPDPSVRMQVAVGVRNMPSGDPAAERLLGRLQADQVAVVREAARSAYRSDAGDASLAPPSDHAAPSR